MCSTISKYYIRGDKFGEFFLVEDEEIHVIDKYYMYVPISENPNYIYFCHLAKAGKKDYLYESKKIGTINGIDQSVLERFFLLSNGKKAPNGRRVFTKAEVEFHKINYQ